MSEGMSLDEFLGHDPSGGGSRGKYLRGWKKRKPPEVRVWLHTKAMFHALWQHNIPRVRSFEDKQTRETTYKVWSDKFNCLEAEATTLEQYRYRTDHTPEKPPALCPVCKMVHYLRKGIQLKRIDIATPIFRFEVPGFDPRNAGEDESTTLHAGPMCNAIPKNLTDSEKKLLRDAGIKLTEAWSENARAKCNYLFLVVDHDAPEDGIQISMETSLVGEKTKEAIGNQMKRLGRIDGNPLLKPYPFQWEYHEKEKEFSKKYAVIDMPVLQLTDEIKQLITVEDPPDVTRLIRAGNVRTLRAQLEAAALVELPWDSFFADAEKHQKDAADDESASDDATDFDYGANVKGTVAEADRAFDDDSGVVSGQVPADLEPPAKTAEESKAAAAPTSKRVKADVPKPAPPERPLGDPCDDCKHEMYADETVCRGCGTKYAVEPDATAAPAKSVAVAAKKPAAPPPEKKPEVKVGDVHADVKTAVKDKLNW